MKLSEHILGLNPTRMVKGGHNEKPTGPRPKTRPKAQGGYPSIVTMKKLSLKKNDVIVLTTKKVLTDTEIRRIKGNADKVFPDNYVVIVSGGMTLKVIGKKD